MQEAQRKRTLERKEMHQRRARTARRERERKRRLCQRIKLCCNIVIMGVLVVIIFQCGKRIWNVSRPGGGSIQESETNYNEQDRDGAGYMINADAKDAEEAAAVGNLQNDRPLLKDAEVEEKLRELAKEDSGLAEIYAERIFYPEELLAALVNNLELTEFVRGYLTADTSVKGGFSEEEMEEDFPLFMQWDSRWGYVPYGGSNIGISGCGPTCLSMVIFALTRDEKATPDKIAAYSMENGHYVSGTGTSWTLMTDAATQYGVTAFELGLDEEGIKYQVGMGNPVICAMRPGDFTTTGHFIVIYDYDEEGFLVNDPNSRERSEKRWTFEEIWYQIKNLWAYQKN